MEGPGSVAWKKLDQFSQECQDKYVTYGQLRKDT